MRTLSVATAALLLFSAALWAQDDAGSTANPGFEAGEPNRADGWGSSAVHTLSRSTT